MLPAERPNSGLARLNSGIRQFGLNSRKFLILGLSLIAMVVVPLLAYEFEAVNSTALRVGLWERYVGSSGGSVVFRAEFWVESWTLLGFTVQDPVFSLTADNIVLYESSLMLYGPTGYGLNFWTNDSSIVRVLNSVNANVVVLTM